MTETITEIVEREASEAEAEFPEPVIDPETGGEVPSEDAPEPERQEIPKATHTDLGEREKKLKSEDTRHENALKKIYGDDFERQAYCPLCIGQGFLEAIPPGEQPEEIWAAITALSGRTPASEYLHPDELVACERCNGWGQVASGAKNEHNAVIICSTCDGRGYFNLADAMHAAKLRGPAPTPEPFTPMPFTQWPDLTQAAPVQVISPPDGWAAAGKPGADTFGRWPGHPRFGIDPSANGGQW